MKKKRYIFWNEGNLIIRSTWSNTAVRVTSNGKDMFTAKRLLPYEFEEEVSKAEPKEPSKKGIIFSMIAFYTVVAIICVRFGGIVAGIIAASYLIATSSVPLYFLLIDIVYAIKNKESVQTTYILNKIGSCFSQPKDINSEKIQLNNIRNILYSFATTPWILMTTKINIIIIMSIVIILAIINCMSFRKTKMIKFLAKLNELLIYRKPTEEQVEMVIFGIKVLKTYETGIFYHL